ncbi:MAG: hypothetical protein QM728_14585 [Gordonia sp. (in: high G+C Gram-positive bacteria)]|uniref:hypothetical protein n=1 Tax=Gordonia sp. (in: high G+C Gram-positive bacteria) TaxID=84139 RepID=UPI0039E64F38
MSPSSRRDNKRPRLVSLAAGQARRPIAARRLPESAERLVTPAELKTLALG